MNDGWLKEIGKTQSADGTQWVKSQRLRELDSAQGASGVKGYGEKAGTGYW